VWSTELGAFLQPDQYGYLSRGGTLWSWPGQNPFRWRDPSGRERTASDYFMQYADTAIDGALGVSGVAFTIATLGAGAEVGLALAEGRLTLGALGRLALAGAGKGAILGGGLETGRQLLAKPNCRGLDGGLIADAAFAGAVSGALFGARGGIAPATTLESSAIRFSQSSVNGVEEIAASMRANGWVGAPVDVVATQGGLVTVDNTRVLAASLTNTPVQAVVRGAGEALPASMAGRFGAATTWGEAVAARIGGQNAAYRAANPLGSWFIGVTP